MPNLDDVPPEMLARYFKKLFAVADTNGDGVLQPAEFKRLLELSGFNFDKVTVRRLLNSADVNHDGVIEYDEFVPVALEILKSKVAARAKAPAPPPRRAAPVSEGQSKPEVVKPAAAADALAPYPYGGYPAGYPYPGYPGFGPAGYPHYGAGFAPGYPGYGPYGVPPYAAAPYVPYQNVLAADKNKDGVIDGEEFVDAVSTGTLPGPGYPGFYPGYYPRPTGFKADKASVPPVPALRYSAPAKPGPVSPRGGAMSAAQRIMQSRGGF
jgi:hypothetical protein